MVIVDGFRWIVAFTAAAAAAVSADGAKRLHALVDGDVLAVCTVV